MSIRKQYDYNDQYQKAHITRITVKFNDQIERDVELLKALRQQDSMQAYIKDLIEKDTTHK